jgi:cytochrome c oxidase subunit 2
VRPLPRTRRRAALACAGLATLVAAGCELPRFGAPDPASEEGDSVLSLWQGFFLTAIAVAALVWGLLIYVLVRYRRRDGDDTVPSQTPYHVPLEIFYTAAPVVVVAVLFAFSVATQESILSLEDEPDVRVEVVGFQWSWEFRYPGEDVRVVGQPGEPPEMVLPLDRTTRLQLVAADVNHAFWVPDFLSKRDLIPGVDNEIDVTPTRAGSFVGRCGEFCGIDHWRMNFSVRVVPPAEFRSWLDEQRQQGERAEQGGRGERPQRGERPAQLEPVGTVGTGTAPRSTP